MASEAIETFWREAHAARLEQCGRVGKRSAGPTTATILRHRSAAMFEIRRASFPDDAEAVLNIWREFVASPSVSLDFQENEAEFVSLPGKYAPPGGCILLAARQEYIGGCIAFRRVNDAICEMKRLYVRPQARGERFGHRLVERLVDEARRAGYREMRLDVLAEFEQAQRIYGQFGFVEAEPVSFNPLPGTKFLGLVL